MKVKDMTRVGVFSALTCTVAIIFRIVPASIVPFSLLPLVVLLAGFVLGPRLGALSMLIYALLGLVGIPVFSAPPFGGIAYIFKPTFGYILGYIPAAYFVGRLLSVSAKPKPVLSTLAVLAGIGSIYIFGLSYLYLALNIYLHKPTAVMGVVAIGFTPFIVMDLIKGAVAVVIGHKLNEILKQN